jgi:hypothetical protein
MFLRAHGESSRLEGGVSTWFRLGVLLTVTACSPIANSEQDGDRTIEDDAGAAVTRDDAGKIIAARRKVELTKLAVELLDHVATVVGQRVSAGARRATTARASR